MYTPLYFAKIMDLNSQPYNNKWTRAIKQTLLNIDDVLLFIWYDTDFMNPSYEGKFKYINDILLSGRSQMYKIMTGNGEIPKDQEEDRALAAELFASYLMPNKWAANKQVYKFDSELELALADSEEIKLPVRILDRLPYQTFYLEFAEGGIFRKNFHGAFVNIVREGNGYLLYAERIKEDGRVMFGKAALVSNDDEDGIFIFDKNDFSCDESDRNVDWPEFCFYMLNALLYLCADNAEIQESSVTKNTYHPSDRIKNKFSEIRQWECGYRYGSEIRLKKKQGKSSENYKEQTSELTVRAKRSILAHTRKAHWHHYWIGPRTGDRKLILHWIPPVYVSGIECQAAVVHRVIKPWI